MRWEERLLDLFDDLEQQADGLALAERDALVVEQSRAEYAEVDLASRLAASVGGRAWVVVLAAVRRARGLSDGAVDAAARPLTTRLGLASALRGLAEGRSETVVHGPDGQVTRAVLGRVGRDFVEVRMPDGPLEVVPFTAIAALSSD